MALDMTTGGTGRLSDSPPPEVDRVAELTALSPLIFRIAMSIGHNRSFAEDVVQETMVKAWTNLASFRGDAPFRVWVVRIANNTAISMLRRQRDQPTDPATMIEAAPATGAPNRQAESRAMLDDLWAAPSVFRHDLYAGQVVIVSGGGTGIGLATSRHHSRCRVVLSRHDCLLD